MLVSCFDFDFILVVLATFSGPKNLEAVEEVRSAVNTEFHFQRGFIGLSVIYLDAIEPTGRYLVLGGTMGAKGWQTDQNGDISYGCCDGKGVP